MMRNSGDTMTGWQFTVSRGMSATTPAASATEAAPDAVPGGIAATSRLLPHTVHPMRECEESTPQPFMPDEIGVGRR